MAPYSARILISFPLHNIFSIVLGNPFTSTDTRASAEHELLMSCSILQLDTTVSRSRRCFRIHLIGMEINPPKQEKSNYDASRLQSSSLSIELVCPQRNSLVRTTLPVWTTDWLFQG